MSGPVDEVFDQAVLPISVLRRLLTAAQSGRSGQAYLSWLTRELAESLGVSVVIIATLESPGSTRAHTRAAWLWGAHLPSFAYDLKGTPCAEILGATACVFPRELPTLFPDDAFVVTHGLQCYAGAPLYDRAGAPLGIIAVMDDGPWEGPAALDEVLGLFAERVSLELDREVAVQAARSEQVRMQAVFNNGLFGVALTTLEGGWLDCNPRLGELLGYDREALMALPWTRLVVSGDRDRGAKALAQVLKGTAGPVELELRLLHADGHRVQAVVSMRRHDAGLDGFVVIFVQDVSGARQAEAQVRQLAFFDELTGLPNRRLFLDRLQGAVARHARAGVGFALHFIDLDHFKDINDSLGHPVGDALLALVAARLKGRLRASDTVGRLGGDEFAVLQLGVSREEHAALLADKLLATIREPMRLDEHTVRTSITIGIATAIDVASDATTLMEHADIALYAAKERRGSYAFHTTALDASVRARIELGEALQRALRHREGLSVVFQPIVALPGRTLVGVEALARWRHPTLGAVPPMQFVPLAEDRGLIGDLTALVLAAACDAVARWRALAPALWVSVNASPVEFRSPGFDVQVRDALAAAQIPGEALMLELTEGVLARDLQGVAERMHGLRATGVRFAIDDFGTGFSSLLYLKRLPVSVLKVAQEFVRDMQHDEGDAEIVRATVSLARAFELDVVAEGVERREQEAELQGAGCRYAQGYRYGRPMSADDITALLRAQSPLASNASLPAVRPKPS